MTRPHPRALLVAVAIAAGATACKKTAPAGDPADAAPAPSASVAATPTPGDGSTDAAPTERRTHVPALRSNEDFDAYSRVVGGERFTKLVVVLATKATHYVDADLYPMHKDFVFAELLKTPKTKEAEREVDKNYGREKPSFLMLYVVHHEAAKVWTFAFWDGDKATSAHLRLAYERIRATFFRGDEIRFRPSSDEQEAMAKEAPEIPTITNDKLYKAAGYQPFHTGRAVGRLRLVAAGAKADELDFSPDEIVVLPEPLADITKVAGIVSQTFSTPLSHVNLRAAAWDIPNVGLAGAAKTYGALAGKDVVLEATDTSASIRLATKAEIEAAHAARKPPAVKVPRADLSVTELRSIDGLHASDAGAFGAKTANLGHVVSAKLPGFAVPPAFGVPIAYYARHMEASGLAKTIAPMLADPAFVASAAVRKKKLGELREAIVRAPLDPAFVEKLAAAVKGLAPKVEHDASVPAFPPLFVRSSTNAEDLDGFSGAGLYDTVPNVRGEAALGDAVKRVWASVWNFAAFEERCLYGIDHLAVHGAVLVQVGIDATAAGVLVTAHPTRADEKNVFTINAKSGLGMRVVEGKKVPEILLYNVFNKALRVVSRSDEDTMLVFDPDGGVREVPSLQKGAPILTTARVQRLADAAQKIRGVFPAERPLDIEWLFRGEEVFVVQARPYQGGPKPSAIGTGPAR